MMGRRSFLAAAIGSAAFSQQPLSGRSAREIDLVLAPSNLGLRPHEDGSQQGAWRAPQALLDAGLAAALMPTSVAKLPRPAYWTTAEPDSRIRNATGIRRYSTAISDHVARALANVRFPIVIGGDCSILLGCLLGARQAGRTGLIHIDGHSDYFHPGNYDVTSRLGAAAGMDLALATGLGEPILTEWQGVSGPLVAPADTVQLGERDAFTPEFQDAYGDIARSPITQITIQEILSAGVEAVTGKVATFMQDRRLDRVWVHVDLDVLDESIMPAVDSPGTPGLDFDQLAALVSGLDATGRVMGVDFAIYDPERDPQQRYAVPIVKCVANSLGRRLAAPPSSRINS